MDDYIDRDNAINDLKGRDPSQVWDTADVEVWVNELPSADVVEVVRCKDCKYCDTGIDEDGNHFLKCLGWVYGGTKEDDYCSHGVRKG